MTSEEQEPTKYEVMFEGCHHTCVMTAQELLNPSRQVYDGSHAAYKSDYYLCFACLREEKGACSISPYHKVVVTTRLRL